MKIAILHTDFRIYWPARLKSLYNFLQEKGHELIVLEIAGKGSPYSFAAHSDVSGFPGWRILFPDQRIEDISPDIANKAVYKVIDELNPDVVLSGALAFYSGAAATRWAGDHNKPLIIFDNARLEDVQRNFLVNFYKKQLYRLSDAILCPAPSMNNSFKFWGFPSESIFYGLNCVDNQFFTANNSPKPASLPDKYFLCIGRQVKKKNVTGLLYAYREYIAKTRETPISLVLIGDGPEHQTLKLIAGQLTGELVHFLPFQTQEQLIPVLKGCTTYILPSLYGETWGLTVNEAMACERPVVVSAQCGCCSTLVSPGENGWVFNPLQTGELTSILLEIGQQTEEKLTAMGKKSKEIIGHWGLEQFDEGSYSAIEYAVAKNKEKNKQKYLPQRLLAQFWKGRFRPEMPLKKEEGLIIRKIALLHTDLRLYWYARLRELHNCCEKLGIRLEIIEISGKGSPYSFEKLIDGRKGLNWHVLFPNLGPESLSPAECHKKIAYKLKELNPDVLISGAIAFHSGSAALKWKVQTGKPIIIFDDIRPEDVNRNRIVNLVKNIFYKNIDALICPAPSHSMGYVNWGVDPAKIFYGVDVVDNSFFKKPTLPRVNGPQSVLLAVGRQVQKKNWITLMRAFVQYKKENKTSSLKLVFIGDGPLHASLVQIEKENPGLDIHFIPFVQQDELVTYYHGSKALVLPSKEGETWGLVVNEAMAAGLPVLVSNKCGCAETLVKENINGWTFDPDNTKEIIDCIGKLDKIEDEEWSEMGKASTEIISEWGLSRFVQGTMDALIHLKSKPLTKPSLFNKVLVNYWDGRYRIN